jgi:hypothetical protein
VIDDPAARGRALADFFLAVEPRLYSDLEDSGRMPEAPPGTNPRVEWECFALYACVRGLVAAGGFNRETAAAIDALHEAVLAAWLARGSDEPFEVRRARVSDRYGEYGGIGQEGGKAGAATVTRRLGEAAARHMAGAGPPPADLAELVGGLHEVLVEGAAEVVRSGSPTGESA